ncbi:hypothetical protein ABT297_34845 [Dactylosporangium sp. NPDC000555]|uniref:hypothetical protein n=1 Tax=Dactylosporangium sp. NPDC000555 TaxID=3154260 RepID=UPI00332E519D
MRRISAGARRTGQFRLIAAALAAIAGLVAVGAAGAQAAPGSGGTTLTARSVPGVVTEGAADITAGAADGSYRQVTTTRLLRGKGPFTHQSDELYATGGNQETCAKGKQFAMVATWYVRNVSKSSAYIDKVVVRYIAGIKGKSVALAKGQLYDDTGKQYWSAGVEEHIYLFGGTSIKRTHIIRQTVSFKQGPVKFRRYATVGNAGNEGMWCTGPVFMQIELRPST